MCKTLVRNKTELRPETKYYLYSGNTKLCAKPLLGAGQGAVERTEQYLDICVELESRNSQGRRLKCSNTCKIGCLTFCSHSKIRHPSCVTRDGSVPYYAWMFSFKLRPSVNYLPVVSSGYD